MAKLVYAADDEKDIRDLIALFVRDAGLNIRLFENGDALLHAFIEKPCDLVLLDVMMPGRDGIEVLRELRKISGVPVIILTARDSELDYAEGYYSGSDDYLTKPFRPGILVMKIKALLRRMDMKGQENKEEMPLTQADLSLSPGRRQAFCQGVDLELTGTEFNLLMELMKKGGDALSREEALSTVWGYEADVLTRVVDETVRRLRGKLKAHGSKAQVLTVWGYGYRLCGEKGNV